MRLLVRITDNKILGDVVVDFQKRFLGADEAVQETDEGGIKTDERVRVVPAKEKRNVRS